MTTRGERTPTFGDHALSVHQRTGADGNEIAAADPRSGPGFPAAPRQGAPVPGSFGSNPYASGTPIPDAPVPGAFVPGTSSVPGTSVPGPAGPPASESRPWPPMGGAPFPTPGGEPEQGRPAEANPPGHHHAGPARRSTLRPRTAVLLALLAVGAAVTTWAEVHYAGTSSPRTTADGDSYTQNTLLGGGPQGTTRVNGPDPDEVFPPTLTAPHTDTSPDGYQATRYAAKAGTGCGPVLQNGAAPALSNACTDYLTASYVNSDHSVVSSVTVLTYATDSIAKKAAKAADAGGVVFRVPGSDLPDVKAPSTVPLPGAGSAVDTMASAVGRYVTVVQSAYTDGSVSGPGLETPTWFLLYTAGNGVVWE